MRVIQKILLISFTLCFPSWAQESPRVVTVTELSRNPVKFDGRLISVRAWLEFGWEGDNFLLDRLGPSHRDTTRPRVWLYCDPEHERQIYGAVNTSSRQPVLATFTGYFHFVLLDTLWFEAVRSYTLNTVFGVSYDLNNAGYRS